MGQQILLPCAGAGRIKRRVLEQPDEFGCVACRDAVRPASCMARRPSGYSIGASLRPNRSAADFRATSRRLHSDWRIAATIYRRAESPPASCERQPPRRSRLASHLRSSQGICYVAQPSSLRGLFAGANSAIWRARRVSPGTKNAVVAELVDALP